MKKTLIEKEKYIKLAKTFAEQFRSLRGLHGYRVEQKPPCQKSFLEVTSKAKFTNKSNADFVGLILKLLLNQQCKHHQHTKYCQNQVRHFVFTMKNVRQEKNGQCLNSPCIRFYIPQPPVVRNGERPRESDASTQQDFSPVEAKARELTP